MSATIARRVRDKQQQLTDEIAALEQELADLRQKESLLREILGQAPSKKSAPGKAPGRKKRKYTSYRPKATGKTVSEEVVAVVQEAGKALTTREIKDALAAKRVGAAGTTIDSTVNRLKASGILKAEPHEGRGNAYAVGDVSKLEPRKKPGRKPGSKTKKKKKSKRQPKKKAAK